MISKGCLVQVGNGIELEAVGFQFEPYRWRPCGVTWDSSRTVVVLKLRRTSSLTNISLFSDNSVDSLHLQISMTSQATLVPDIDSTVVCGLLVKVVGSYPIDQSSIPGSFQLRQQSVVGQEIGNFLLFLT